MTIQTDSREKPHAIRNILKEFDKQGIKHFSSKLFVGDYQSIDNPRLVVDRKRTQELCQNVVQDKERFIREIERANEFGIHIVFLCENDDGIEKLQDVINWTNPRLKESPLAVSGERLFKILSAISKKYGVSFLFCDKRSTGKRIIEILSDADKNK